MFGIFKQKPEKVINEFQVKAFNAWGVSSNDTAAELRFKAALGVYVSIFLSVTIDNRSVVERLSQRIFKNITDTVSDKKCRVSDVFLVENKVKFVDFSQADFLAEAGISSASVIMNGFGVLDCLAQVIGNDCAKFLQGRDGDNLVSAGTLMLRDLTVGGIDGVDTISGMQVASDFTVFFTEMSRLAKADT